jgi:signal peptidase I
MEPGFIDGERIVISRVMIWIGNYGRGDLVVCKQERGGRNEYVVKRIIGIPGDLLEIRDGNVYVNGTLLSEDYLMHEYTAGNLEIELASDEYFVMGDNRSVSADSRNAGPVKASDLVGRIVLRWFPFDKITVY